MKIGILRLKIIKQKAKKGDKLPGFIGGSVSVAITVAKGAIARAKQLIKGNSKIDSIKTAENLGIIKERGGGGVNVVGNSRKIEDRN